MRLLKALVVLTLLTAGAATTLRAGAAAEPDREQLSVLWWGGQSRHEKTLAVIELFEQRHPDITIDPEYLGWTGYWDRLAVLAAADDMPDVFQMVIEQFPLFSRKNLVADLTAIPAFDHEQVDPAALSTGVYEGRLIGLVLGINAFALVYNPEIFERANVAPPTADWSWDDLVEASIAVRERVGVYGVDSYGSHNDFRYWVRTQGHPNKYSESGAGPGWSDDSIAEAFFERVVLFDDNVMPPFAYTLEYASNEDFSAYTRGESAMSFIWSNLIGAIRDSLGTDSIMVPPPGPGSHDGLFLRPANYFSIAAASPRPETAARFLNFFVGDIDANRILAAERGVPVVASVRAALAEETTHQTRMMIEYVEFVSRTAAPPPAVVPENVVVLRDAFDQITRQVAFGQISPREGAELLRARWTELMRTSTPQP